MTRTLASAQHHLQKVSEDWIKTILDIDFCSGLKGPGRVCWIAGLQATLGFSLSELLCWDWCASRIAELEFEGLVLVCVSQLFLFKLTSERLTCLVETLQVLCIILGLQRLWSFDLCMCYSISPFVFELFCRIVLVSCITAEEIVISWGYINTGPESTEILHVLWQALCTEQTCCPSRPMMLKAF